MKGLFESRCVELSFSLRMRAVVQHGPVAVSVSAGPSPSRVATATGSWLSQKRGADSWDLYLKGIFDYCSKDVIIDHAVTLTGYGKDSGPASSHWCVMECMDVVHSRTSSWERSIGGFSIPGARTSVRMAPSACFALIRRIALICSVSRRVREGRVGGRRAGVE